MTPRACGFPHRYFVRLWPSRAPWKIHVRPSAASDPHSPLAEQQPRRSGSLRTILPERTRVFPFSDWRLGRRVGLPCVLPLHEPDRWPRAGDLTSCFCGSGAERTPDRSIVVRTGGRGRSALRRLWQAVRDWTRRSEPLSADRQPFRRPPQTRCPRRRIPRPACHSHREIASKSRREKANAPGECRGFPAGLKGKPTANALVSRLFL